MERIVQLFHILCVYGFRVYSMMIIPIIYFKNSLIPKEVVSPQKEPEILNLSAKTLARKIRNKEISSEEVVKAFVARCKDVNSQVNAIIEDRFEDAIEEAKNVDLIIQCGTKTAGQLEKESPLFGVPITVKGTLALEGLDYSAGSKIRQGYKAPKDSKAVDYLRRAGAIPIAVTNAPEMCCSAETSNRIIGFTRNPYDLRRTAGASSGGEAAVISSGGSVLGVGSDFAGSIRYPAMMTGIFGHKPSAGVVSNDGNLPDCADENFQKMMTIGPISRYAEDLKLALGVMAGPEAKLLNLDTPVNLSELKIYYFNDDIYELSEIPVVIDIRDYIKKATQHFQEEYRSPVEQLDCCQIKEAGKMALVQMYQIKDLKDIFYLNGAENESNVIVEILKVLVGKSDYTFSFLHTRLITEWFLSGRWEYEAEYASLRDDFHNRLNEILGDNGVLFLPTYPTTACYRGEVKTAQRISASICTMIVNVLGFPATQVPMGLNEEGMPFGFQVVAARNQDRLCLAVAEELEKAFGGWIPPLPPFLVN